MEKEDFRLELEKRLKETPEYENLKLNFEFCFCVSIF